MKNSDEQGLIRNRDKGLIPKHRGYRRLKTFQIAELVYEVTVRF